MSLSLWDHFGFQPNEKRKPANLDDAVRKIGAKRSLFKMRKHVEFPQSYLLCCRGEAAPTPPPAWNHRAARAIAC